MLLLFIQKVRVYIQLQLVLYSCERTDALIRPVCADGSGLEQMGLCSVPCRYTDELVGWWEDLRLTQLDQ